MPFSEREQVERQELIEKANELKGRLGAIAKNFNPKPLEAEVSELRQKVAAFNPAAIATDEERKIRNLFREKQVTYDIWKKFPERFAHLNEMIAILEPADMRGLDEDRCNWLVLAEELDDLEKDIVKIEKLS